MAVRFKSFPGKTKKNQNAHFYSTVWQRLTQSQSMSCEVLCWRSAFQWASCHSPPTCFHWERTCLCVCLYIIFSDGEVVGYLYKNFKRKSWRGAGAGHGRAALRQPPDKSGSLAAVAKHIWQAPHQPRWLLNRSGGFTVAARLILRSRSGLLTDLVACSGC